MAHPPHPRHHYFTFRRFGAVPSTGFGSCTSLDRPLWLALTSSLYMMITVVCHPWRHHDTKVKNPGRCTISHSQGPICNMCLQSLLFYIQMCYAWREGRETHV